MRSRARLAVGWTLALAAAAGFASLGAWQLGRAVQKDRIIVEAQRVLGGRRAVPLAQAADDARVHGYDWSAGRGHFLDVAPVLLDNQQHDGRVGMRAYAAFAPAAGTPLLVDLGWQAVGGDRVLPRVAIPAGEVDVRGLLAPPPSSGIRMGAAMSRQGDAWLAVRLETAEVSRALDLPRLAPRVLRLDPALPFGYTRDLALLANTLTPERHRGYALQWFGLAATTLVLALVLTVRRSRR